MELTDLYSQVLAAQSDAQAGNLSTKRAIALLDAFRSHLEADNQRPKETLDKVLSTLSYSEEKALKAVLEALPDSEGMITASKVADAHGVSRSTVVSVLSKLEGAGIIESRSLGQKGTRIKILFPGLRERLQVA